MIRNNTLAARLKGVIRIEELREKYASTDGPSPCGEEVDTREVENNVIIALLMVFLYVKRTGHLR